MFLETNGHVKVHSKISEDYGDFTGSFYSGQRWATSMFSLGDLDGDGVFDMVVGSHMDDDGAPQPLLKLSHPKSNPLPNPPSVSQVSATRLSPFVLLCSPLNLPAFSPTLKKFQIQLPLIHR